MNYQYNYDKMDNITEKATEHGDYAYDYDDIYRLVDADNPTLVDEAFAYDPVGNRLTAQGVAGTWTYNVNNELNGYDDVSYVYDANGNMKQKTIGGVVTKFFYNTEDRLERVEEEDGTLIATYDYDPFGRRLWKEVSGVQTYFFYADEGLIGEYDTTGTEIKTYGYKPGSTWTTDPLFMKEDFSYYFYHNDHLGTPQKMTAVNGAVVWNAKYSSFGEAEVDPSSTITNNLRFPGQYEDQESGLHYNRHRYYDPEAGRYLRNDPVHKKSPIELGMPYLIPYLIKMPQTLNNYAYGQNNPLYFIDPLGLAVCEESCWTGCLIAYEETSNKIWAMINSGVIEKNCEAGKDPKVCVAIVQGTLMLKLHLAKKKRDKCYDDCDKACDPKCP